MIYYLKQDNTMNTILPVSVRAIENETSSVDFSDNQNPIVNSDSTPILSSTEILTTPSTNSSESGKQLEVSSSEESIETEQTTDTGTIQSETTSSTVNEESVSKEINTNSEKAVDWETEDKGTYILLKRYTGSATDLVVPNEINGKPTKLLDIDRNVIPNLQNLTSFIVKQNQNGQKVGLETTNLESAFYDKNIPEGSNLINIDLSGLDTSKVTSMNKMFDNCAKLTNLILGDNFDTSQVTDMTSMFSYCLSLKIIDLGEKFDMNIKKGEYMFYTLFPSPLLVITKDSQLLNSYDYSTDNRVPVSKPYLDANGGLFEDYQPTKNYFTKVANTPEYCSLENVQNFLNTNKPTKENYRFKQWETSPKEATNLEELLNTTYTATWQDDSIIDSNIPSQDQDNVVTRPLTAYGIAYVPKQFTFASTSLKDNGEQIIPFTKMESFHIGIRDVRNTESSWTVSAQLEWTGQTLPGAEIVTTNATGVVKKNNNNGVDDFDASRDLIDCPTSEVIGKEMLLYKVLHLRLFCWRHQARIMRYMTMI